MEKHSKSPQELSTPPTAKGVAVVSDRYLAEILRIAEDAIISVDAAQSIVLFNHAAERIFGYRAEEVLSQPLEVLLPQRLRHSHGAHMREFGTSAETSRVMAKRGEILGQRKDGTEFPCEATISKLPTPEGMVFTVILRDITDRKATEHALQKAHDELETRVAQRTAELARQTKELARSNADLEQFASVASHDLQEPLRMVASYTQLLAKRYRGRLDADADEFMQFAVDGAMRMQRLINDLLAFSRVGTRGKDFAPTPLAAVMEHVRRNLAAAIQESGARISVGELPVVRADETQMELLLQNLVSNAIKFRGPEAPVIEVNAERQEGAWQVDVSDQGIGIDPQYADRIFVIFQRLHAAAEYPGTGIGLAICKKIVERHGGQIRVAPAPSRGTRFSFTLPDREEAQHEPRNSSDQDPAGRG
jgi:PAS domain S-box-containing protein